MIFLELGSFNAGFYVKVHEHFKSESLILPMLCIFLSGYWRSRAEKTFWLVHWRKFSLAMNPLIYLTWNDFFTEHIRKPALSNVRILMIGISNSVQFSDGQNTALSSWSGFIFHITTGIYIKGRINVQDKRDRLISVYARTGQHIAIHTSKGPRDRGFHGPSDEDNRSDTQFVSTDQESPHR